MMSRPGMRLGLALVATTLLMAAGPATAADFELTPMVGLRTGGEFTDKNSDERYEFDDDASVGLMLGWDLDGQSVIEVGLMTTSTLLFPQDSESTAQTYEIDVTDILRLRVTATYVSGGRNVDVGLANATLIGGSTTPDD